MQREFSITTALQELELKNLDQTVYFRKLRSPEHQPDATRECCRKDLLRTQPRLKGCGFPRSIISYAVWAHDRFALGLRDVEDRLAERGIVVRY